MCCITLSEGLQKQDGKTGPEPNGSGFSHGYMKFKTRATLGSRLRDESPADVFGSVAMTKTEAQDFLKKLGITAVKVTDEIAANVDALKAEMDTRTRRKVRAFWIVMTAVGVLVGIGIGTLI